jgi:hypothetical protein
VTTTFPVCPGFSLPVAGSVTQLKGDSGLPLCSLFGVDFWLHCRPVQNPLGLGCDVVVPALATKTVNRSDLAYFESVRRDRLVVCHKTAAGLALALASADLVHCDSLDCKSLEQLHADAVAAAATPAAETETQKDTPKDLGMKEEAIQLLHDQASATTLEAAPCGPKDAEQTRKDVDVPPAQKAQTAGTTKTKTPAFTFHLACHCLTPLRDVTAKVMAIGLKEIEKIKKLAATSLAKKIKESGLDGHAMVRIHAESKAEINKAIAAVQDPDRIPLNKLVSEEERVGRSARAKAMADALASAEASMMLPLSSSSSGTTTSKSQLGLQGAFESFQRDGCLTVASKSKIKKGATSDLLKLGKHMLK